MIWAVDPIFIEEKEDDENEDRLLSVLKGHSNVVTTCRWSPDGKSWKWKSSLDRWLASASDDETIRIWKKSEKEEDNEEEENDNIIRYECAHIFKGHHSGTREASP